MENKDYRYFYTFDMYTGLCVSIYASYGPLYVLNENVLRVKFNWSMWTCRFSFLNLCFTGVCNLCNGGVKFVRDNDRNRFDFPPPLIFCRL